MRHRYGLSLVEMMCALTVGGLVLLLGHATLANVLEGLERVGRRAAEQEAHAIGNLFLTEVLLMVSVEGSEATPFFGDSTSMHFFSRCRRGTGGLEPCRILVSLSWFGFRTTVRAHTELRGWQSLAQIEGPASFLFLGEATATWTSHWGDRLRPPEFVAVVGGGDTTVFSVAPR